jgi:hypothetical protein
LAEDDWGRWAVPPFNLYLAFALQLRKSTENFSQGSRLAANCHVPTAEPLGPMGQVGSAARGGGCEISHIYRGTRAQARCTLNPRTWQETILLPIMS